MAHDEFAARAARLAASNVEEGLIQAQRDYQDAQRSGDEYTAADALKRYAECKRDYDLLTGTGQQQQASGQLSNAQQNFLSRRLAGGDELSPSRMRDYALAHTRAVNAGWPVDSAEYFAAVARSADTMGDGRQPPLNEREVAKMCGIDERVYAANAAKLAALKRSGRYQD